MRLKSGIWVSAYLRRCNVEGVFAAVRRRGAEEAGAIFIKISRLDGTAILYGPAPQSAFDEAHPGERFFTAVLGGAAPVADAEVEARLVREFATTRICGSSRPRIAQGAIFWTGSWSSGRRP